MKAETSTTFKWKLEHEDRLRERWNSMNEAKSWMNERPPQILVFGRKSSSSSIRSFEWCAGETHEWHRLGNTPKAIQDGPTYFFSSPSLSLFSFSLSHPFSFPSLRLSLSRSLLVFSLSLVLAYILSYLSQEVFKL